jgi:hypothetical protein
LSIAATRICSVTKSAKDTRRGSAAGLRRGEKEMEFDELSNRVIGCAIEVHRALGPGLAEGCILSVLRVVRLQKVIGYLADRPKGLS